MRKQVVRPRYQPPARHLALVAADGTALHAVRLAAADPLASIVLVHGITNSTRTPGIHRFAHEIAAWADVFVLDLRGHGASAGTCTLGELEPLDVAAAVRAAHAAAPDRPVVVVGSSLGGLAAALCAARPELSAPAHIAGTVAVSPPTHRELDRPGAARLFHLCTTPRGRIAMRAAFRTRVRRELWDLDDVTALLPGRSEGWTIVVHDPAEPYFGPTHAELLYATVGDPRDLWSIPGGGHGTDLLTPALAARLEADVRGRLKPSGATPGATPPPTP
jgi:pimeloyl-ACP methyl ester carboxylesterase